MALMGKGTILCVRCRKKMVSDACACGSIYCYIRFYHHGGRYNRKGDENGGPLTKREATRMLIELNKKLEDDASGKKPFHPVTWSDREVAESKFLNRYAEFIKYMNVRLQAGKITREHMRHIRAYRTHFKYFEPRKVAEINTSAIDDFILQLTVKSKTQRNIVGTLHRFLEWLAERGKLATMPHFPAIEGGDETPRKALRRNEQALALNRIPADHRDIIKFMMETGLRPSEAIAALVGSVDRFNRCIWVQRRKTGPEYEDTTKNRQKLSIPLNSGALEIAERMIADRPLTDLLFINSATGRGYTAWFLSNVWRQHSRTGVCLYEATRHSFCSQIVPLTDPFTAQRLMRHKDKRSTEKYYHADSDRLQDVVEQMYRGTQAGTRTEHNNGGKSD